MKPAPGVMIDASSSHAPKFRTPVPSGCPIAGAASAAGLDDALAAGALVDARLVWPKALPRPLPCAATGTGASAPHSTAASSNRLVMGDDITVDRPRRSWSCG